MDPVLENASASVRKIEEWIEKSRTKGRKGSFKIMVTDGKLDVLGTVYGLFGIHNKYGWKVTHIPTGSYLYEFDRLRDAKRYLFAIHKVIDWDFSDRLNEGLSDIAPFCSAMRRYCDPSATMKSLSCRELGMVEERICAAKKLKKGKSCSI